MADYPEAAPTQNAGSDSEMGGVGDRSQRRRSDTAGNFVNLELQEVSETSGVSVKTLQEALPSVAPPLNGDFSSEQFLARIACLELVVNSFQEESIKNVSRLIPGGRTTRFEFQKMLEQDLPRLNDQYRNVSQLRISKLHVDLDLRFVLAVKGESKKISEYIRKNFRSSE